jgi:hypothetical protein
MTKQGTFLIALLMTAAIGSQAHAGMSGTSARVEQITNSEAQAAVQASQPQARPQQAGPQQRRAPARPEQAARPSGSSFDGIWSVTNSPGCGLAPRSAVEVIRGRISGPGLSGKVDPSGSVRTVAHVRIRHLRSLERLHRHLDSAQGLGAGFNRPPSPPAPVADAGFCRMQDRPGAGAAVRPCLRTADRET